LSDVSVRCGIFQGDTLSPLLFCLSLYPPSYLLDELPGCKVVNAFTGTHLLYMDDLKLFAPNDAGLQRLIDLVKMFSADIIMSFGIEKCAKLTIKRGKPMSMWPVVTLGDEICELSYNETYRYLGFPEYGGIDHGQSKSRITDEFLRCLRIVWHSLLYGQFKVQANNSFCIPLLSYGLDRSFQWLQQSLHSESESTLFAIHNQVICTRVYQTKIMGSQVSDVPPVW